MPNGYKLSKIYVGSQKVRPAKREPSNYTIARYPLTSTTTTSDMSGNGRNMSSSGTPTYGTYAGVNCAYFSGGPYLYRGTNEITGSMDFTVSAWFRYLNAGQAQNIFCCGTASGNQTFAMWIYPYNDKLYVGGYNNDRDTGASLSTNAWYQCVMSHSNGTIKVYLNNSLVYTGSVNFSLSSVNTRIGNGVSGSNYITGYISDVIEENRAWTANDVDLYYKQTKSIYGY